MSATESYWICDRRGTVLAFGAAPALGSLSDEGVEASIVAMTSTAGGKAYWLLGSDGGVFSFGTARFFGSLPSVVTDREVEATDIEATIDGNGYWVLEASGTVHAFGSAIDHGSLPDLGSHVRAERLVALPSGEGYWIIDHVGGIFSFGEANFHGSMPGINHPGTTPCLLPNEGGHGYWLISKDGHIEGFGCYRDQSFPLGYELKRTRGIVDACPSGANGWLIVDMDGVVYPTGDAGFEGSAVGRLDVGSVIGIARAALPDPDADADAARELSAPVARRRWSS